MFNAVMNVMRLAHCFCLFRRCSAELDRAFEQPAARIKRNAGLPGPRNNGFELLTPDGETERIETASLTTREFGHARPAAWSLRSALSDNPEGQRPAAGQVLKISGLTYQIDGRVLLRGASAVVPARHKAGLVGRNGTGKSTLLRLISGEIEPDSGSVELLNGARIGKVSQKTPEGSLSPREFVIAADTERSKLLKEAAHARDSARIADIQLRLADIGAAAAPARAGAILAGLGFDEAAQLRPLDSFSGGWRMRAALASTLFLEPDLLLLDEPSNHLDLESRLWLESHLRSYQGTIILVSHDRRLLNSIIDKVIHLEMRKLVTYGGNYDRFETARRQRAQGREADIRNQTAKRQRLQKFVDRFRYKASKARQAQSKLKALQRMEKIQPLPPDESTVFRLPQPENLAPPLITLDEVSVGYSPQAPVLAGLSLRIDQGDRIALLGGIGNGKSTLLRLLYGELEPLSGSLRRSPGVRAGYFQQQQTEAFDTGRSPCQELGGLMASANESGVRARLGSFGISQMRADAAIRTLSGGERARLLLACVTHSAPHLLLLDEPTNHLDMESREALVHAVNEFEGAVVLVTHDLHLVELCAEQIWVAGQGRCRPFDGDINDYGKSILAARRTEGGIGQDRRKTGKTPNRRNADRKESALRRNRTAGLRRQAANAETLTKELGQKKAAIERRLADPSLYAGPVSEIARLGKELSEIKRSLAAAEISWLEAEEQIERLDRQG